MIESQPYTNREMDMKFSEIKDILQSQNSDLDEIKIQTKATNGNVAKAFLQISETKADVASNWRAVWVGGVMFAVLVIPLCAVIYSNLQKSVSILQGEVNKIQQK